MPRLSQGPSPPATPLPINRPLSSFNRHSFFAMSRPEPQDYADHPAFEPRSGADHQLGRQDFGTRIHGSLRDRSSAHGYGAQDFGGSTHPSPLCPRRHHRRPKPSPPIVARTISERDGWSRLPLVCRAQNAQSGSGHGSRRDGNNLELKAGLFFGLDRCRPRR